MTMTEVVAGLIAPVLVMLILIMFTERIFTMFTWFGDWIQGLIDE